MTDKKEYEAEYGVSMRKMMHIIRPILWDAYTQGGIKALWEACHEEGRHGMHRYDPVCDEVCEIFALGTARDNYIIIVPVAELKDRSLGAVREEGRQRLAYGKQEEGLCAGMTGAEQRAAEEKWGRDVEVILQGEKDLQGILDKDGVRGVLRYLGRQGKWSSEKWESGKEGSVWINFTADGMQIEMGVPSIAKYCDPQKETVFTVSLGSAFGQGELEARLEAFYRAGALERKYRKVSPFALRCAEDVAGWMDGCGASMELVFRWVRDEISRLAAPGGGMPMYSFLEIEQLRKEEDDDARERLYIDLENGKRDALEVWRGKYLVERKEEVPCAAEEGRSGRTVSIKVRTTLERDWISGTIGQLVDAGIYGVERGEERVRSAFFRDAVKGVVDLMGEFPVKYDAIVTVARRVVKDPVRNDKTIEVFSSEDAAKIASESRRHERLRLQVGMTRAAQRRLLSLTLECKAFPLRDRYTQWLRLMRRRTVR